MAAPASSRTKLFAGIGAIVILGIVAAGLYFLRGKSATQQINSIAVLPFVNATSDANNEYLSDLIPNSEIHPLDAGHFAWEQAAEEYGRLVADWVSGGYRRVTAG